MLVAAHPLLPADMVHCLLCLEDVDLLALIDMRAASTAGARSRCSCAVCLSNCALTRAVLHSARVLLPFHRAFPPSDGGVTEQFECSHHLEGRIACRCMRACSFLWSMAGCSMPTLLSQRLPCAGCRICWLHPEGRVISWTARVDRAQPSGRMILILILTLRLLVAAVVGLTSLCTYGFISLNSMASVHSNGRRCFLPLFFYFQPVLTHRSPRNCYYYYCI